MIESCPSTNLGVVIGMFIYFFANGVVKGIVDYIRSLHITCKWGE